MKSVFFFLSSLFCFSTAFAQTWTWISAPKAGTNAEIRITDAPIDKGPLQLAFYTMNGNKLVSTDGALLTGEKSDELRAQVVLPANSSWVYLALKDRYSTVLSTTAEFLANDAANPLSGRLEKALISSLYYRQLGMEKDDIESTMNFRDAVIADPEWFNQPEVLKGYFLSANASKSNADLDVIKSHLADIADKPKNASEALLVQAYKLAKNMGDSILQASLRKGLDKTYPKSLIAQEEMMNTFQKAASIEDKIKFREQFKSKYPITDENRAYMDQMTASIADLYATNQDWTNVKLYVDQIQDPLLRARIYNTYAWTLSGESVDKEGSHYDLAADMSGKSLQLLTPAVTKPVYLTKNEWVTSLENAKAGYSDTYALIRYKQGHVDEAIDHQLFAVQNAEFQDPEMNERYAVYLQKANQYKQLEEFMDKIMVTGKASPKVKEIHKEYWTKTAGLDKLYKEYLSLLEDKAHDLLVDKVMKEWKEDEAIDFSLKDLQGNSVSLSDYKGKTVVLDFWATWCGPCKASFPGMKKAVEHFASDKNVVFLFIDTWERMDNKETYVADFIRANNYPFHVLMDDDNKVVEQYKVEGIPTKFIIGPDQKIRFAPVGYGGNPDELFEEIKIMIELARNGSIVKS